VDSVTLEQIEKRKQKGADFARNVLEDDDLADDLEDESVEDYAERKRLKISNLSQRRVDTVANGNGGMTKSDLEDCIDQATEILTAAYTPEASREELAAAVGDALDALSGEADEDDDQDGDDDQDDDDRR